MTLTVLRAVYGKHYDGTPAYGKAYPEPPKGTWDKTPSYTFSFDRDPGIGPMTLTRLGECPGALRIIGPHDGYLDDAEYLADVTCADCGNTRADLLSEECAECGTRDCTVRWMDCPYGPDVAFCEPCTPSHRGCPSCDPMERCER